MSSASSPGDDFEEFDDRLAREFLRQRRYEVSEKTVQGDVVTLRQYLAHLAGTPVEEATYQDVIEFLNGLAERGCTVGTARSKLSTISQLHSYLNHFHRYSMPEVSNMVSRFSNFEDGIEREPIAEGEVKQLIEATDCLRDALLIAFVYYEGVRASGAADLKYRHVHLDDGKVEIRDSKNGDDRTLRLHPKLGFLLKTWLTEERAPYPHAPDSDHLFVGDQSEKLDNQDVWQIVHDAAERAGIQRQIGERADGRPVYRVKPHVLRHSFATHAFDGGDGMDIEEIAIFLGHDNTRTTKIYIHDYDEERANDSYEDNFDGL